MYRWCLPPELKVADDSTGEGLGSWKLQVGSGTFVRINLISSMEVARFTVYILH